MNVMRMSMNSNAACNADLIARFHLFLNLIETLG